MTELEKAKLINENEKLKKMYNKVYCAYRESADQNEKLMELLEEADYLIKQLTERLKVKISCATKS